MLVSRTMQTTRSRDYVLSYFLSSGEGRSTEKGGIGPGLFISLFSGLSSLSLEGHETAPCR